MSTDTSSVKRLIPFFVLTVKDRFEKDRKYFDGSSESAFIAEFAVYVERARRMEGGKPRTVVWWE